MALSKPINTTFGVQATYWKVAELILDFHNLRACVTMLGFVDQAAREAGAAEIDRRVFCYHGHPEGDAANFPFRHDLNNTQVAYTSIKTSPEFEGAVDMLE